MITADQLADFLESKASYLLLVDDGEIAELVGHLNDRETLTRTNSELQTSAAIALALPMEQAAAAMGVFDAAGQQNPLLKAMYFKLCSTGLNFADPLVQATIDAVFTGDYAALAAPLKAMGITPISPMEQQFKGFAGDVTQEQVEAAVAVIAKRRLHRTIDARRDAAVAAVNAGTATTWAEVAAILSTEE